ncbi:MAG: hypothetical protein AAGA77_15415 [Bacteroidota bacterium]
MFIPPNRLKNSFDSTKKEQGKVQLKTSHLLVDHTIATKAFGTDLNVNLIYYPNRATLMIAPESDDLFTKLHKAKKHMLKDRNAQGDKTIALHELLIDNEIDNTDRNLKFEYQKELGVLSVTL